jgi:hypothetical protein
MFTPHEPGYTRVKEGRGQIVAIHKVAHRRLPSQSPGIESLLDDMGLSAGQGVIANRIEER